MTSDNVKQMRDGSLSIDKYLELNRKYPGEYIILVDGDVVYHTKNEEEASNIYYSAFERYGKDPEWISPVLKSVKKRRR